MTTRKLEIHRPVPPAGMSVSQLSTIELQQELKRRVQQLQVKRDELLHRATEIEQELKALGVIIEPKSTRGRRGGRVQRSSNGSPQKTRREGKRTPLVEVLSTILDKQPLTTREAADAALTAGYETQSRNFVNSVNVALHRDERFEKKDGKWQPVR